MMATDTTPSATKKKKEDGGTGITTTTSSRRRVGFTLGSGDSTPLNGDVDGVEKDTLILLDDQEQDNVVEELSILSQQSMLLWRVAALLLLFLCFVVYAILPLPNLPFPNPSTSSKTSPLLLILYRRSLILLELFLGTLSTLTEFITTLPEPSTPTRQLAHVKFSQNLKHKLHHALHLPPELSNGMSATDMQRLRLSAPLIAATAVAAARMSYTIYSYTRKASTLAVEDALLWSASFVVLFISFLARSYANQLDRDLGELKTLKYANKGV